MRTLPLHPDYLVERVQRWRETKIRPAKSAQEWRPRTVEERVARIKSDRLGITAKCASAPGLPDLPPEDPASSPKWARQGAARLLAPWARVAGCLRTMLATEVEVIHVPGRTSAVLGGLVTCGSVWHCAVCASKITNRRAEEVAGAVARWEESGAMVMMATYTVPHDRGDHLDDMFRKIRGARRRLRSGRGSAAARRLMCGSVRAVEVTHGINGWHPHIHELIFLPGTTTPAQVAQLESHLRERWAASVEAEGLGVVNEHGFHLAASDAERAAYVAKFGRETTWTVADEVTRQPVKRGRRGSRSPVDLLDAFLAGDDQAGGLWQAYAIAMQGERQLVWSPNLRKWLGLAPEKTDEELAAEREEQGSTVALLSRDQWQFIVANDLRGAMLLKAGSGDRDVLWGWLLEQGLAGASPPTGSP